MSRRRRLVAPFEADAMTGPQPPVTARRHHHRPVPTHLPLPDLDGQQIQRDLFLLAVAAAVLLTAGRSLAGGPR